MVTCDLCDHSLSTRIFSLIMNNKIFIGVAQIVRSYDLDLDIMLTIITLINMLKTCGVDPTCRDSTPRIKNIEIPDIVDLSIRNLSYAKRYQRWI